MNLESHVEVCYIIEKDRGRRRTAQKNFPKIETNFMENDMRKFDRSKVTR